MACACCATTMRPARETTSTLASWRLLTPSRLRNNYSPISGKTWTIGEPDMRTVTLEVSSREETNRRLLRAFEGQPQGEVISFETPALLFKVLTQKRWELLAALTGAGP